MQSTSNHLFQHNRSFTLESGITIPGFHLAYSTCGKFDPSNNNVVWIFHALTANSNAVEWWPGLVGEGRLFDPAKYFIICVNMPGSCYGSLGPLSENPETGSPWYHNFPFFTPRDMIRAFQHLKNELGIQRIHIGIGGSMGGQQLLEWAIEEPELFEHIIPIGTNAVHSSWGRAFNASQRMCIEVDTTWKQQVPTAGLNGMEVARSIALLSYRHYHTYAATQIDKDETLESFKSESYQKYQGLKLARRFNAFSYYVLTKGMDSHNVGRGRGETGQALQKITARTLVIGVDTDVLFPVPEQAYIADHVPGAVLKVIHSIYGHDGFLLEFEKIEDLISDFVTPLKLSKEISK
jgi:homoserine O-acetyltransferase/O-succinyltransferase